MVEPITPQNLREHLTALAEGALGPTESAETIRWLAEHPESVAGMYDDRPMIESAARAIRSATPPVSAGLRERIAAMGPAQQDRPPLRLPSPARPTWSAGWWMATAASVLIGIGIGRFMLQPAGTTAPVVVGQIIPASLVADATHVHADCSRLARGLHSAGFPADQGALAGAVRKDLHSNEPYPDLSSIGFQYEGAGPCAAPLSNTIHLLYRSTHSGAAISLFLQRNNGQFSLDADRVYTVSVAQSPFPMLAWRTDQVVYFLIADDPATEQQALGVIRSAPQAHAPHS